MGADEAKQRIYKVHSNIQIGTKQARVRQALKLNKSNGQLTEYGTTYSIRGVSALDLV